LKGRMCMKFYRLQKTTVALHQEAHRPVVVFIPEGTVLRVPDDVARTAVMVEVQWDGETVEVFAVDLRARGELVEQLVSAAAG